jgi:hypothetical protein
MQAARGSHVQKVGAAGSEFERSPPTKFIGGFQDRIAPQVRLPPETGLSAFSGPQRHPGNLAVGIHARLPQVMAKLIPHE